MYFVFKEEEEKCKVKPDQLAEKGFKSAGQVIFFAYFGHIYFYFIFGIENNFGEL